MYCAPTRSLAIPLMVIVVQMALAARRIWRHVRDDLALLRDGLTMRAHLLRLRPHRSPTGDIEGALLDCAIPVAPRRTYMGSISYRTARGAAAGQPGPRGGAMPAAHTRHLARARRGQIRHSLQSAWPNAGDSARGLAALRPAPPVVGCRSPSVLGRVAGDCRRPATPWQIPTGVY